VVVPELPRMLIDYTGNAAAGPPANPSIIVSRPTPQSTTVWVGVLQITLPSTTPIIITGLFGQTDTFFTGGPSILVPTVCDPNRIWRYELPPNVQNQFSAQMIVLLSIPVGGGGGCSSLWSASAAMWFDYLSF
jgi:hypothetical protein